MADLVGQQLGNYRLARLLGQGGFAEVYLGEHVYLKSHAAIKVLRTQLSAQQAPGFVREAQTLASLTHPHIVRVLDFAVQDGAPFLVIEYATHGTLLDRHARGTRLPLEMVVLYVQQVAAALQYAHDRQLIHRDVKPENLLLNERFDILLSDFGLGMFARHTHSQSIQQAAGTVFYMAPEQIKGKPRPASDQYALGIVVYEWLTGDYPFRGSLTEIVTQHLVTPPPSLREQVPGLSPAVEEVVLRALAKEPKQRYSSVLEFATTLQHAAQGSVSPPALSSSPASRTEPTGPLLTLPPSVMQKHPPAEVNILPTLVASTASQEAHETGQARARAWQAWQEPQEQGDSTPLVGRGSEWAMLTAAWQSACAGRPQLLLLSGEAGIGKTRLAEALQSSVGRQGSVTATARCYAVEGELAYAPVASWLRSESIHRALAALDAAWLTEVARLLPALLQERPGLPPPGPLEEDWHRQRFFEALARALLSRGGPLLLLLDDLQWCDRETLALVHYLLRFDPQARLLIVGTLRLEERSTNQPLESLLLNLHRDGQVSEIPLGRLDAAETAALAGAVAGQALSPALAAHLYRESEGNPLFVVETMRMGMAEHRGPEQPPGEPAAASPPALLSPTIQAVVAARLEQLSPSARELVNVAAVIGRAFSFEVLKQVSGVDEDLLVQALDEMWQRRIIREQGADGYDFGHDKLREGAYAALSRARRRLLHRRVADTMERLYGSSPDAHLADLAYHFYQAGAWEQAAAYGQRAAEQAYRLYASRAAIEQFTRALDAAQRGSIPPSASLYRGRGQAYETLGEFEQAQHDFTRALEAARTTHDRVAEWQSAIDLGFLWAGRDYAQAETWFRQALILSQSLDDPALHARSLNRIGNWHLNVEQPHEALRYHREALAIFQQLHDTRGIAETLDLLGMASYLCGDLVGGTVYYRQAIALFDELGNREGLTSSLATLVMRASTYHSDALVAAASLTEALPDAERAVKVAREIGQRSAEAYALFQLGLCLGSQGEYSAALAACLQSLHIAEEIEHHQWQVAAHVMLGGIYSGLLALQKARDHFEQALALAQGTHSLFWIRVATGYLASASILLHDYARAETLLHAALDPDTLAQTLGQRMVWCASVELALAQGHPTRALEIIEKLSASGSQATEGQDSLRLLKLRGEALAALQRSAEAEATLSAAQALAVTQGARPMLWRICIALGILYQTQGRDAQAEQAFAAARTLVEELSATITDEPLQDYFSRQAGAMLSQARSLSVETGPVSKAEPESSP